MARPLRGRRDGVRRLVELRPAGHERTGPVGRRLGSSISAARVAKLRETGWPFLIGVSAAQASAAAGVNRIHPDGPWIDDPGAFYEFHHYLGGLSDSRTSTVTGRLGTRPELGFGLPGLRPALDRLGPVGTPRWQGVPTLIGEFAMDHRHTPALVWETYRKANVGAAQWATGPWSPHYPYRARRLSGAGCGWRPLVSARSCVERSPGVPSFTRGQPLPKELHRVAYSAPRE